MKNKRKGANSRGRRKGGRGKAGSIKCICTNCGHEEVHKRGTPCSEKECPECGIKMRGENC